MKQCKIIHIYDGKPKELYSEDRYFADCFPTMEAELEAFLNEGYEVRQIVPHLTPELQENGQYGFYESGYTFYLEREIEPEAEEKTFEDYLNEAFEQIMREEAETPVEERLTADEERERYLAKYGDIIRSTTLEYAGDACEETEEETE